MTRNGKMYRLDFRVGWPGGNIDWWERYSHGLPATVAPRTVAESVWRPALRPWPGVQGVQVERIRAGLSHSCPLAILFYLSIFTGLSIIEQH